MSCSIDYPRWDSSLQAMRNCFFMGNSLSATSKEQESIDLGLGEERKKQPLTSCVCAHMCLCSVCKYLTVAQMRRAAGREEITPYLIGARGGTGMVSRNWRTSWLHFSLSELYILSTIWGLSFNGGGVFSFLDWSAYMRQGLGKGWSRWVRQSDSLVWLESIVLFLDKCPPLCDSNSMSDLSFSEKGTGEWSLATQAAKGSSFRLPLVVVFLSISFSAPQLTSESEKQAQQVGEGSLLGVAWSNQGGWLATHCLLEGRASRCWYELRNRNTRPLK